MVINDMRGFAVLLCGVGTAHALVETCSALWPKLAHLSCPPQDQLLRDHLELEARHAPTRTSAAVGADVGYKLIDLRTSIKPRC